MPPCPNFSTLAIKLVHSARTKVTFFSLHLVSQYLSLWRSQTSPGLSQETGAHLLLQLAIHWDDATPHVCVHTQGAGMPSCFPGFIKGAWL